MDALFLGDCIDCYTHLKAAKFLLVTLSTRASPLSPTVFGMGYFSRREIAWVALKSNQNHWWQTKELETVAALIKTIIKIEAYNEVICYGASMGAMGALLLAPMIGAKKILAVGPVLTVDPSLEPRWGA